MICPEFPVTDIKVFTKPVQLFPDINCVLPRLDRAETENYIRSHLDYAGCDQELFTSRAIDEIFRVSAGTMRVINRICEKSLMYGYQQHRRLIDNQDITFVSEHELLEGGSFL